MNSLLPPILAQSPSFTAASTSLLPTNLGRAKSPSFDDGSCNRKDGVKEESKLEWSQVVALGGNVALLTLTVDNGPWVLLLRPPPSATSTSDSSFPLFKKTKMPFYYCGPEDWSVDATTDYPVNESIKITRDGNDPTCLVLMLKKIEKKDPEVKNFSRITYRIPLRISEGQPCWIDAELLLLAARAENPYQRFTFPVPSLPPIHSFHMVKLNRSRNQAAPSFFPSLIQTNDATKFEYELSIAADVSIAEMNSWCLSCIQGIPESPDVSSKHVVYDFERSPDASTSWLLFVRIEITPNFLLVQTNSVCALGIMKRELLAAVAKRRVSPFRLQYRMAELPNMSSMVNKELECLALPLFRAMRLVHEEKLRIGVGALLEALNTPAKDADQESKFSSDFLDPYYFTLLGHSFSSSFTGLDAEGHGEGGRLLTSLSTGASSDTHISVPTNPDYAGEIEFHLYALNQFQRFYRHFMSGGKTSDDPDVSDMDMILLDEPVVSRLLIESVSGVGFANGRESAATHFVACLRHYMSEI